MYQFEKNASQVVFAQYLETKFRDLRLDLNKWVTNNRLMISFH